MSRCLYSRCSGVAAGRDGPRPTIAASHANADDIDHNGHFELYEVDLSGGVPGWERGTPPGDGLAADMSHSAPRRPPDVGI